MLLTYLARTHISVLPGQTRYSCQTGQTDSYHTGITRVSFRAALEKEHPETTSAARDRSLTADDKLKLGVL